VAQLVSRGTLVRNRWDFYEASDYITTIIGIPIAGNPTILFLQNISTGVELDVYRVAWSQATPAGVVMILAPPPLALTLGTNGGTYSVGITPTAPGPGVNAGVAISTGQPTFFVLEQWQNNPGAAEVQLANGGAFVTLPPLWALYVQQIASGTGNFNAVFHYQQVLDLVAPAP
jgi:hypothetical protein